MKTFALFVAGVLMSHPTALPKPIRNSPASPSSPTIPTAATGNH